VQEQAEAPFGSGTRSTNPAANRDGFPSIATSLAARDRSAFIAALAIVTSRWVPKNRSKYSRQGRMFSSGVAFVAINLLPSNHRNFGL
jgi:hypothetical protein